MYCTWCRNDKTLDETQFIIDENCNEEKICVCKECFPEWADHEIADLTFKVSAAQQAVDKIECEMLDECSDSWKLKHISEIIEDLKGKL